MKNTMIATFGSLVLASMLAILVAAQAKPAKPVLNMAPARAKVSLKCTPSFTNADQATQVYMENNTGASIAKGTLLHWKTSTGISGAVSLPEALQPGKTISGINNVPSGATTCTAYFVK